MRDVWADVVPFAGTSAVLDEHSRALPQVDQLCGPFWIRLALLADGRQAHALPSEADVGLAAGTLVCEALDVEVRPPAEPAHRAGWESLPHTADSSRAGTGAAGVVAAVDAMSQGRLSAVPITGSWLPANTGRLLEGLAEIPATIMANVDTGEFWGSHTPAEDVTAYLADGDDRRGAPADWDVGHFVVVWGRIAGAAGTAVAVADTYPSLGTHGRHVQPLPRLAAALAREKSSRPGGLLVVVGSGDRARVEAAAAAANLDVDLWD